MPALTKLCARCGLLKPRLDFGGHPWCAACEEAYEPVHRAEMIRAANERRYGLRKAMGQCQRCSEPAQPGRVLCADCARNLTEARRARVERANRGRASGRRMG